MMAIARLWMTWAINSHELVYFHPTSQHNHKINILKTIVKDYILRLRHTTDLSSSPAVRFPTPLYTTITIIMHQHISLNWLDKEFDTMVGF